MNYAFKFCLTINSLLFSLVVFLVNQGITLNDFIERLPEIPKFASYAAYVLAIFCLNIGSLWLTNFLGKDTLSNNDITSIEPANDAFLPSYLGYFFVALSVTKISIFIFVFSIISIFIFFSRISYFNPLLFLHGYSFYYILNSAGVKVLVISKKKIKTKASANFPNLRRINNFTFIDKES